MQITTTPPRIDGIFYTIVCINKHVAKWNRCQHWYGHRIPILRPNGCNMVLMNTPGTNIFHHFSLSSFNFYRVSCNIGRFKWEFSSQGLNLFNLLIEAGHDEHVAKLAEFEYILTGSINSNPSNIHMTASNLLVTIIRARQTLITNIRLFRQCNIGDLYGFEAFAKDDARLVRNV